MQNEDQFREAALKSAERMKVLAFGENFPPYELFLAKAQIGSVGVGHTLTGKEKEKVELGTAARGGVGKERDSSSFEEGKGSTPRGKQDRKGDHPHVVLHDNGTSRMETRRDSMGLHITGEIFDDDSLMFKTDIRRGLVIINKGHASYILCADKSERVFQLFVDQVVTAAINMAVQPDAQQEFAQAVLQEQLKAFAVVYTSIDARTL